MHKVSAWESKKQKNGFISLQLLFCEWKSKRSLLCAWRWNAKKIQISLIFCHDGFWTSICAWLYILMLSLWQNKPHSTSLVIFFPISDQFQTLSHSQPFTIEKNWLSHTSLLKLSSLFQNYLSIVIFMIKVLDRTLYWTQSADSFILQRIHAMKLYF